MSVGLPSYQIGEVVIGREAQRLVAIGDRFRERAAIEIDVGPGVKQPFDLGHLPDCFGYVSQTLGWIAFAAVNFRAVGVGAGLNGKEHQRRAEICDRGIELIYGFLGDAALNEQLRVFRLASTRLCGISERSLALAAI